jgi:hypothetical protein
MMAVPIAIRPADTESLFDVGRRLNSLLEEAERQSTEGQLPESARSRLADVLDALRVKLSRKTERDPRSLFDLDEHLVELMDRVEEAAAESGEIPAELVQEVNDYLEAFRWKVDRIASYWRWQESMAAICGQEAERLAARKKAADGRVERLKGMLLAFMTSRRVKRLEGDKASIGMQQNSTASLVIDNPLEVGECFCETAIRFTKTEFQELLYQLPEGDLRTRLEALLKGDGWQINGSAVRASIVNGSPVTGARLVKGHHVRVR